MTRLMKEKEIAIDNFENGFAERFKIGKINATIKLYREFEEDKIMMKLVKGFNLTEEKSREYLNK